jgi:hypothetical protein
MAEPDLVSTESGVPTNDGTAKKICVACGLLIPKSARVCATCKSYQASWRNTLTYFAGIAGFLTVSASALTFAYSHISSIIKTRTWTDKVSVSSLKYPGSVLFGNSGDGAVFINSLEFYWINEIANMQIPVEISLKKGEIKQFKLNYRETRSDKNRPISNEMIEDSFFWISNSTGKPFRSLIEESKPHHGGKCVIYLFLTADYPEIARVNRYYKARGERLVTSAVEGYVNWSSAHTGKAVHQPLDNVVLAFRFDPKAADCKQSEWDGDH